LEAKNALGGGIVDKPEKKYLRGETAEIFQGENKPRDACSGRLRGRRRSCGGGKGTTRKNVATKKGRKKAFRREIQGAPKSECRSRKRRKGMRTGKELRGGKGSLANIPLGINSWYSGAIGKLKEGRKWNVQKKGKSDPRRFTRGPQRSRRKGDPRIRATGMGKKPFCENGLKSKLADAKIRGRELNSKKLKEATKYFVYHRKK